MIFADEGSSWKIIGSVVALILGFRPSIDERKNPIQIQSLTPIGWNGLTGVPDFRSYLMGEQSSKLVSRLREDLPIDEASMGKYALCLIYLIMIFIVIV